MMQDFLKNYIRAINLDDKQYDCYFPNEVKRSDFLLFDKQVVCEFKEIQDIKIKKQVEKLSQRTNLSEQDFKRSLYNSIEQALSTANKQVKHTKEALNLSDALGLIILENRMSEHLSTLSLIDAANRKMLGGLVNTDCILCLDFVNTFSNLEGEKNPTYVAQVVSRGTEESKKLSGLLNQLIKDFCSQTKTPLIDNFKIKEGTQEWIIDEVGKYKEYSGKIIFISEKKQTWRKRAAHILDRWWWIIPLPFIYYDWFIR